MKNGVPMQRADRFSSKMGSLEEGSWDALLPYRSMRIWSPVCPLCLDPVFWVRLVWMVSFRRAGLSGSWLLMFFDRFGSVLGPMLDPFGRPKSIQDGPSWAQDGS